MRTISVTEFRRNTSRILDWVEAGEEVQVSRRGKVIALLVPVSKGRVPSWKKPHRPLVVKGVSLSKAVIEDRR